MKFFGSSYGNEITMNLPLLSYKEFLNFYFIFRILKYNFHLGLQGC
jgi:hypothetical protein